MEAVEPQPIQPREERDPLGPPRRQPTAARVTTAARATTAARDDRGGDRAARTARRDRPRRRTAADRGVHGNPATADGIRGPSEMIDGRRLPRLGPPIAESATVRVPHGGPTMASFNKVILMGNLTRDPQLKYLPSQTAVAEFGLAVQPQVPHRQRRGPRRSHVRRLHRLRQAGRGHQPVLPKGKPIFIEGRLKYDQLGRQARRRQAQQADRRRRELPVPRRPRRRRWRWRWRRRRLRASGGRSATTTAAPQRSRAPQQRRPRAPARPQRAAAQPAAGAAVRRRTAVQGRRYSVLAFSSMGVSPMSDSHETATRDETTHATTEDQSWQP